MKRVPCAIILKPHRSPYLGRVHQKNKGTSNERKIKKTNSFIDCSIVKSQESFQQRNSASNLSKVNLSRSTNNENTSFSSTKIRPFLYKKQFPGLSDEKRTMTTNKSKYFVSSLKKIKIYPIKAKPKSSSVKTLRPNQKDHSPLTLSRKFHPSKGFSFKLMLGRDKYRNYFNPKNTPGSDNYHPNFNSTDIHIKSVKFDRSSNFQDFKRTMTRKIIRSYDELGNDYCVMRMNQEKKKIEETFNSSSSNLL